MNLKNLRLRMHEIISNNEITFLKDIPDNITINKYGKFCYYKFLELDINNILKFLYELEDNEIYTLIPFITKNNKPDQPYIILSQQILITKNSNSRSIVKYIYNKCMDTLDLYNIDKLEDTTIVFKFKKIEFTSEDNNKFV